MADGCFVALLNETVGIRRPRVEVSASGNPRTAEYDHVASGVPCSLQPAEVQVWDGLVGRLERVTHVAYLEPLDLRAGDLLVKTLRVTSLSDTVGSGSRVVSVSGAGIIVRGDRLQIGEGERSELAVATSVAGTTVHLMTPLGQDHEAGERVSAVAQYEVVGVRDEAGRGHHLRADLRQSSV